MNKVNRTFLIRDKEKILNNLYDSYGNVTKQSNELKQALFNCEKDLDLYKKDFETIDVINSKLEDSKNKIIEIQALESCIDEKVQHEESVSKFKYEIEFLILDRRHVSNKVLDIENEKNKILKFENQNKDIIFKISEVEDKINKLSSLRTFLIKYSKSLNSYDEAVSVYRKTKPIYDKIFASYSEKSIEITRSEEIYLRNQAGILAKNLKENSPCMVCGSTKHPNKAMVLENCVDESSLKELRQQFIDLQDKRNEISDKMINLNNQVSIFENNIKEFYHELKLADSDFDFIEFDIFEINTSLFEKIDLLTDNLKDELNLLNEVNEKISKSRERVSKMDEDLLKLHDEIKVLDEKINKIQSNISLSTLIIDNNNEKLCKYGIVTKKDYTDLLEKLREDCQILINKTESLKNNLKQCEDEIIKLRAKIEIKENDILKFESEIKINKEYFFNSLSENGFVSVEEYKAFKLSEDEFHKRADFLQKKRDEYRFLESTISNLKSQIKINEGESIDGIQKSLNDLNQNFNEIENLEKDFYNKIMLLESAKNNITSISKDIFEIDTYRTNLNELSKISNGNNKYKVSFERYILGIYFKEIIAAANIRFLKLTNGRYLFRHLKDGFDLRIQQGLDVSVFDNYTSSERRINTLSGGESFKASLSLALGLSDVIQRYSGGISIDTLFIDEGFGSLDSDSLQSALDCLLQANSESKLIGIVSHVQELKHFISSKIEVLDSPHGSKIKINV